MNDVKAKIDAVRGRDEIDAVAPARRQAQQGDGRGRDVDRKIAVAEAYLAMIGTAGFVFGIEIGGMAYGSSSVTGLRRSHVKHSRRP